jgi:hypothetical protein
VCMCVCACVRAHARARAKEFVVCCMHLNAGDASCNKHYARE